MINWIICVISIMMASYNFIWLENYDKAACWMLMCVVAMLFEIYKIVNEKSH